jgi:choline monooxygenase
MSDTMKFEPDDLRILPLERSETIPSAWYTNPHMMAFEKECIFARSWQYVGHASSLRNSGSYVTGTAAGNPIIVVRGKDDVVRGFFNVCRHRGGPLAIDERGACNALQCRYHGWTYLLDGSLRGVPKWDRVELFDRKDFGLIPVQIDAWEGLVFANVSNEILPPVRTFTKGIAERIAPCSLRAKEFHSRVNYEVNCNWKVYVDNYLEGYHLPYVHPELCNLLDYQQYETEVSEHYSLQYSPFTGTENLYGTADGQAFYYFLFPNTMLNILPGRLQINTILPIAHNRTRVLFDYYYDDVHSTEAAKRIRDDIEYSDHVQQEDIEICEHVQRGLESIAYDKGRFSVDMENGVYHFQCLLKEAYAKHLI